MNSFKQNSNAIRPAIAWTDSQKTAIAERGKDLLISASAGSGKTTVMIERIVSMIQQGEVSVESILVLTFTNASAADMKVKLRKRLEKIINEKTADKNSNYISEQINSLAIASIGTFHKFCGNLVRTYFNIVGVNPAFEILDETESSVIKSEVLDDIIATNYDLCSSAIDTFCINRKTDNLKKIIISICEFLASRDDGVKWLDTTAYAGYDSNLSTNIAMSEIVKYYNQAGEYYLKKFNSYLITAEAEQAVKAIPFITQCIRVASSLTEINCYDDLHNLALTTVLDPLRACVGKNFSEYEKFKNAKTKFKKIADTICEHYSLTREQMTANQERDKQIIAQLIKLVQEYSSAYARIKLEKNKLDFSDLEKYACIVLADNSIAEATRLKYKYIFIDEYQDTNPMQEKILCLIGGSKNIFMVGDVKQSIYGFRGCEAAIFAGKMTDFDERLSGKVVKLNENFRSNSQILDFVNCVFGKIMKTSLANIDYNATSKFQISKDKKPNGNNSAVEVILVDTKYEKEKTEIIEVYDIVKDQNNDQAIKAAAAQARIIAERISVLAKDYKLSDIAVLARSRTHFDVLLDVLGRAGITADIAAKQNAADLYEISMLNNMLFAVSNFYNDVPLVLLMQSFVFNFSPDELAQIKLKKNVIKDKTNFFELISEYIKTEDNNLSHRLESFIVFLNKYYTLTKKNCVSDVLNTFLTEFRVFDMLLLLPEGQSMVKNIYTFINKLRNASYGQTVSQYLYLLENDMIELSLKSQNSGADKVQVMTMHASKGLEFPVVIIFDTGANFNTSDNRRFLVVNKQCGLCVYSADADEFIKTNSIARLGAQISGARVLIAEEMRLFYVALTRAKNRLIIVGAGVIDNFHESCDDFEILEASNYLHFLAPTFARAVPECNFTCTRINIKDINVKYHDTHGRMLTGSYDNQLVESLKDVFDKKYPYVSASATVYKNSVSSLTKREEEVIDYKPLVLASCDRGVEYGTHFHKLMQKAIFDSASQQANRDVKKCIELILPIITDLKVLTELTFLQNISLNGETVLVQGVIDLLAVGQERAVLIDYKTTNATSTKLVELYNSQLSMYATAAKQALNMEKIDVYIYSTVNEKLIPIQV